MDNSWTFLSPILRNPVRADFHPPTLILSRFSPDDHGPHAPLRYGASAYAHTITMAQMRFKSTQNNRNRRPRNLTFWNSPSYVEVASHKCRLNSTWRRVSSSSLVSNQIHTATKERNTPAFQRGNFSTTLLKISMMPRGQKTAPVEFAVRSNCRELRAEGKKSRYAKSLGNGRNSWFYNGGL
jgi:hypothetical protein